MPYRAGAGGGLFGSSVYPDSRPKVDIGGAIDAIQNGASSMIRAAYQRRLADNELAVQAEQRKQAAEQIQYQHGRDQIADQRFAEEQQYRRGRDDAADAEKALVDRRSAIERGFTPETSTTSLTPSVQSVGPLPPAPTAVRKAMTMAPQTDPTQVGALPAPQAAGIAPQSPATAPIRSSQLTTTTTPESYDPSKGAKFAIEQERAVQLAERDATRAQNQMALKERGGELAKELARLRASLAKPGSSGSATSRAITGNKLEEGREKAAAGLVDFTGGSYDAAVAYLNSPDGQVLRDEGVKPQHLMYAHSQYSKQSTAQAVRLQTGATGMEPGEAVGAVKKTQQLVGGPTRSAAAPPPTDAPKGVEATPATPAAPPAPAKPPAAAPSTPSAPSTPPAGAKKLSPADGHNGRPFGTPTGHNGVPFKEAPTSGIGSGLAEDMARTDSADRASRSASGPGFTRAALSDQVKQRAQSDTAFAKFLIAKGYRAADWAAKK